MSECMILGTDERDVEEQLSLWLKDQRGIKISRVNLPKRERRTLLTRLGGKKVPRVSIRIEYQQSEAAETNRSSDIAEQFKELQQLRKSVQEAELDSSRSTTMSP